MAEKGSKSGRIRKAIIAKNVSHPIKQLCSESVKKKNYNLSSESSFLERQSHKEKEGKN